MAGQPEPWRKGTANSNTTHAPSNCVSTKTILSSESKTKQKPSPTLTNSKGDELVHRTWSPQNSLFSGSFLCLSCHQVQPPHMGPCHHWPSSYSNKMTAIVLHLTSSHTIPQKRISSVSSLTSPRMSLWSHTPSLHTPW